MAVIAIPVCLAILAIALRGVHGPKYWIAALCFVGFSIGIIVWLSKGEESPLSIGNQVAGIILFFVIPILMGFAIANLKALRARPLLLLVVVPLVFLGSIYVDILVGANLDILQP